MSGEEPIAPSAWAIEKFGRHAGALAAAMPMQLASAHAKAHAAHLAVGLKKRSPYGVALAGLVREHLAQTARELEEAVREVRGYEYAVINDHAFFPFRYADRPRPLDRARLPSNASPTRRRLFRAHGPQPPEGLFDLDDGLATDEYLGLHEAFEELGLPRSWSASSSPPMRRTASTLFTGEKPASNRTERSRGSTTSSSLSLAFRLSDRRDPPLSATAG
ncbi:hypothetical protein OHA88_34820 [Streptomyces sp. NBC_00353]|uniref:hypothetical protein n=1 Tax=Streptomyces sp. NBC_00353 TaxID=2975722 RepID=UPI002E2666CC